MKRDSADSWAIWWIRPSSLLLYFIFPLYCLLYILPQLPVFATISLKTLVYFDQQIFVYGLYLLVAFYLGCLLPLAPRDQRPISQKEIHLGLDIVGGLALVGYAYMLRSAAFSPGAFFGAFKGGVTGLMDAELVDRGAFGPGSLQQLGLAFFAMFCFTLFNRGAASMRRRHRIMAMALLALTLFRAVCLAQRLALIELFVPISLYFVLSRVRKAGPVETMVIGLFPIISLVVVVLFFAGTEFFRSWDYHKDQSHFWDFMLGRLATYYYTALNNGAVELKTSDWPTYSMMSTVSWIYRVPLISDMLIDMLGPKYYVNMAVLDLYADPEFNNTSGLFPIIQDLGVPGAAILYFFIGVWLSFCYRCFVIGTSWGAFYYPLIYLTVVEVLRVAYLGNSKLIVQVFLFWILTLIVRAVIERRSSKRARRQRALRAAAAFPAAMEHEVRGP